MKYAIPSRRSRLTPPVLLIVAYGLFQLVGPGQVQPTDAVEPVAERSQAPAVGGPVPLVDDDTLAGEKIAARTPAR